MQAHEAPYCCQNCHETCREYLVNIQNTMQAARLLFACGAASKQRVRAQEVADTSL